MALGPTPEFSWSTSRDRAFDYCRRQYWFQYYGSWKGWEDRAPARVKEIYLLKQLQTLPTWSGSAVHEGVAMMFHGVAPAEVVRRIHEQMRADYLSSVKRVFREPGRAKAFGLDAHAYDLDIPRERFKQTWDGVKERLEGFPELPYLSRFDEARSAGRFHYVEPVDGGDFEAKRFRWEEVGDFPVFAIPDVAYERADGTIEVLDWKTGREPSARAEDEVTQQLVLYARALQDKHPERPPIHRFEVAEIYLPRGSRWGRILSAADVEATARKISDSAEAMQALLSDIDRNVAEESRFDLVEATQKCRRCTYRKVCSRWDELQSG
jgi:hypothetical protein